MYSGLILQKARLMLGASHGDGAVEDAAQEIMVKAYQNMRTLRGDRVKPWLMSIAHHHCLDAIRRHKRQPKTVKYTEEISTTPESPEMSTDLLAELAPNERSVLLLRVIDRLDYREISVITGLAEGTLRNMVSRVLTKLRREVDMNGL